MPASKSQDSADMPVKMTFRNHVALKRRASHVLNTWLLNAILLPYNPGFHKSLGTVLTFAGRRGFRGHFQTKLAAPEPNQPSPPPRTPLSKVNYEYCEAPRIQCESLQTGKPATKKSAATLVRVWP